MTVQLDRLVMPRVEDTLGVLLFRLFLTHLNEARKMFLIRT
jgi:hypothetical protein